jgi:hypothetical protein
MKLTSALLAVSLLMIGTLASAATTDQASLPEFLKGGATALMTPVAPAPTFMAKSPSVPDPTEQALCGTCSDTLCQGQSAGYVCKVQNGLTYKCQHVSVDCSFRDCTCWTGPLP